jgi:hypothetical protein
MHRVRLLLIGALIAATSTVGVVSAATRAATEPPPQQPDNRPPGTVYTAKFSCGEFGKFLKANSPNVPEGPYAPGYYQTAINVHNPNQGPPMLLLKKAVLIYQAGAPNAAGIQQNAPTVEREFEIPRPHGPIKAVQPLTDDWAFLIDCQDIRAVLLPSASPAPTFIEGDVVVIIPPVNDCAHGFNPNVPDPCVANNAPPPTPCGFQGAPNCQQVQCNPPFGPPPQPGTLCSRNQPSTLDVDAVYTSHGYTDSPFGNEGFSQEIVRVTPSNQNFGPNFGPPPCSPCFPG